MYPVLRNNVKLTVEPIGGQLLVVNENKQVETYIFNVIGTEILKLCNGKNTVDEITQKIAKKHDDRFEKLKPLVMKFLNKGKKKGHLLIYQNKPSKNLVKGIVMGSTDYYTPLQAEIELTYNCNLKCKHCYIYGGEKLSEEITTEDWKIILYSL